MSKQNFIIKMFKLFKILNNFILLFIIFILIYLILLFIIFILIYLNFNNDEILDNTKNIEENIKQYRSFKDYFNSYRKYIYLITFNFTKFLN